MKESIFAERHPLVEALGDFVPDFRAAKPVEPRPLSPHEKEEIIEAMREGVGLLRMASQSAQWTYAKLEELLKLPPEKLKGPKTRDVLVEYLLRLEGFIHVFETLAREFGTYWAHLRADQLHGKRTSQNRADTGEKISSGRARFERLKEKIRNLPEEKLREIKEVLNEKQKIVFERHVFNGEALATVAAELGISRQRAQQICREALLKAEKALEAEITSSSGK